MSGEEIKKKIDENNNEIQNLINGNFVLNKDILRLLDENKKLRAQCEHDFKDGFCQYCYSAEVKGVEN